MSELGAVAVPNASGATYAIDCDGKRWVKKSVTQSELIGEAIGWLMSWSLGVSVPAAAILQKAEETCWLSEYKHAAGHWDEGRAHSLANPDQLGGMLALDAVIGNWDRHEGNILMIPQPVDSTWMAMSIDTGNSWVGNPTQYAGYAQAALRASAVPTSIDINLAAPGAMQSAAWAAGLEANLLREYVQEACDLAGSTAHATIESWLKWRCSNAPALTSAHLENIAATRP